MKKKPMKQMKAPETKKAETSTTIDIPVETEQVTETSCSCEDECTSDTDCTKEDDYVAETEQAEETVCCTDSECTIAAEIIIQYQGKEFTKEQMMEAVKADWYADDSQEQIKNMKLYFKPEDGKIYYVINDVHTGSVDI